ncbi:hypothetical protein TPS_00897 [Trichinella pseudospiralis]
MWHYTVSTMIKLSLFSHAVLISVAAASNWIPLEDEASVEPLDGSCVGFDRAESQLMEFSSPNYPAEYPPNIMCIRKICAPPANLVYIDFRGSFFEIESPLTPDFCPFDYLEIRNGPFRFSIKKEEKSPKCAFINIFGAETGMINSETVKKYFRNHSSDSLDCVWKIKGSNDQHKLRLIFSVFSLAFPNECELNFIEIYLSHTDNSHMSKRLCGTSASGMDLDSNVAHVRLFLHQLSIADTVVEILYYTYLKNSQCPKNYFSCGDSTCIPYALVCNGRSDCTSDFDETNCIEEVTYKMKFTNSPYLAVFIVFMATLVIISVGSILWQLSKCCRKKVGRSTEEEQSNGANSALTDAKPKEDSLTNELKPKLDVCNPIAKSPYSTKKHCQPSLEDNTVKTYLDGVLSLQSKLSMISPFQQLANTFPSCTSKFRIPRPKPILLSTFRLPAYSSSARTDASTNASSSVDSPFAQDSTNTELTTSKAWYVLDS